MRLPVEHRFATSGGDLCWFEWGTASKGPTLLFLHATGFHARCWDAVINALPDYWHIIALDLRGHGRSYRPGSLNDWLMTANDVAEFVRAQITSAALVVGHSMGGFVAARAAAICPGRIEQLLLVDPVMMAPESYVAPVGADGSPADHPVARRRNKWDNTEQMIAHFSAREPYVHWRPDVLADYCRFGLVPAVDGEGFELGCPPVLEASAYMGSLKSDPYAWIGDIRCKTTILRARNAERSGPMDFSISPTAPNLWRSFPDARDVHWSDLSHFIPMEEPDRLAELIAGLVAAA
ncbi:MAG: alpha/beta hydrolase [Sphingomonadales bacterium]|nr:alpha/beta hydrolase [Sphingomonadales bacterium]